MVCVSVLESAVEVGLLVVLVGFWSGVESVVEVELVVAVLYVSLLGLGSPGVLGSASPCLAVAYPVHPWQSLALSALLTHALPPLPHRR